MIITDIEEISKSKVKVSIDSGATFSLYKRELKSYGIDAGADLPQEKYTDIVENLLVKRAKLRCMNLLKSRDYTRRQLEDKLCDGYYPKEVIEQAISYVEGYGYIDDLRYAVSYIGYKSSAKSMRQIRTQLTIKGIAPEVIDEAFDRCRNENGKDDEENLIKKLLEKKKYDKSTATYEEKQKIIGFLYRKGFPLDKIYRIVE